MVAMLSGFAGAARYAVQQNVVLASSQATAQAKATPTPDPTDGIEVTALTLEPTRFCKFGTDAYVAFVPMDITVVNGRRAPIILSRSMHVQRVLVGKNNDEVQAHKYEVATPVQAARLASDVVGFGPQPDDELFVVLKHNQKFEFTAVQGIPVRNNPAQQLPGTASPGSLSFSVEVQTWPFSRQPGTLPRQWVAFGDLITTPVIAYPTIIRLPANPPAENCGIRR
jgi:hypothetical protein